ncbi:DUF4126 family protein [Mycobacterium sp.]|uniref:DUF4126 family protein n=1 Tax=Mycobacterium sp. TaxID=1785 RepID=UPI0031D155FF
MTHLLVLLLALLVGVVAGLRPLVAPAVIAWAAALHWINLDRTWVSWLSQPVTVAVLSVVAVAELVVDKLPATPRRTAAVPFVARIILGAFAGAVIGTAWAYTWTALGAAVVGAVLGTVGGYRARTRLVAGHGHDLPIALLEDAVAVLGGVAIATMTAVL